MKLQLLPLPVKDIDKAKAFYMDKLDFVLDHDTIIGENMRIVQLTPQGSDCSIALSQGLPMMEMPSGSQRGLHLVVDDVEEARRAFIDKGGTPAELIDTGGVRYVPFTDPDGNQWTFQDFKD